MNDAIRLILDNLWLVIFIIIGLSQFFTQLRTSKTERDVPDGPPPFDGADARGEQGDSLEEIIRKLREQQQSSPVPPPLPPQRTPVRTLQESAKQTAAAARVMQEDEGEHVKRLVPDQNFGKPDAYSLPGTGLSDEELKRLQARAAAFEKRLGRGSGSAGVQHHAKGGWRDLLARPSSARNAVILREVLSAPVALR